MSIIPLGNKILIQQKVSEAQETTASGIIIQNQLEKKFPLGLVKAIGEKVESIKIGDQVLFEGWNGEPVSEELGGEKNLLIIGSEKIIAKYE